MKSLFIISLTYQVKNLFKLLKYFIDPLFFSLGGWLFSLGCITLYIIPQVIEDYTEAEIPLIACYVLWICLLSSFTFIISDTSRYRRRYILLLSIIYQLLLSYIAYLIYGFVWY